MEVTTLGTPESPFGSILTIDRPSTAEQIAGKLRELILSGELAPNTPLKEAQIAAAFDTSRNTVRETLLLLTHEGIVQRNRNKGAIVAVLTKEDIEDMSKARKALELSAVDAYQRGSSIPLTALEGALGRLAEAVESKDPAAIPLADALFHRALVSLHGSGRLMGLYDQLWTGIRLATLVSTRQDAEEDRSVLDEHQRVYDYLAAGDFDACRKELERMIDETELRLLRSHAAAEGAVI
ncbi:GntR family transcriptional regulator [uncultured Arthrobacter sp.]|uniref:GntR family transcriptional regulator n=1 Tax=uncultured Arthrobacter sp. TaxID=114050 RepID=UPI0025EF97B9|nr:GntR family transcriptional regulator [uncultured Arthrobacter sp.]